MNALLTLDNVHVSYGSKPVVKGVSFHVGEGKFCALLGLNGCGKTTLLRGICGFLPIKDGECLIQGTKCNQMNERERARRLAYIPQRSSPISGQSVLDVVLMGFNARLHLLDQPGASHRAMAMKALQELGLEDRTSDDYGSLSEGQKQLVILARALVQDTPVLLMDEPDSALDFVNRNLVLTKIRDSIHQKNKAGLITLHDPNFALYYCDRLFLMKDGVIKSTICPKDATKSELEAAFREIYGDIEILSYGNRHIMVHR